MIQPAAKIAALVTLTFLLAGCQAETQQAVSETTVPAATQSKEAEPSSTEEPIAVDARESLERFKEAAAVSCEKAMAEGVTESATDGSLIAVMVSEADAIEGYSAAYYAPETEEYGLLFETDVLVACGAHLSFVLAEEAEAEAKIAAEQQPDGSFFVLQDFGEFGVQGQSYFLEDGLFVSVSTSFDDYIRTTDISYGKPSDVDREILDRAFAEFFG